MAPGRFNPGDESQRERLKVRRYSLAEMFRHVGPMLAEHRARLALSTLLIVLAAVGLAVMPLLPKFIVDEGLAMRDRAVIYWAAAGFFVIGLVRMVSFYTGSMIVLWAREGVIFRMRQRALAHVQRLCMRFHDIHPSGYLHSRMFEHAIGHVGGFIQMGLTMLPMQTIGLALAIVLCGMLSWPMTGVIVLGAAAYVTAAKKLGPRIRERTRIATHAHNWIAGFIFERIRGTQTIQALSMEDKVQSEFDEKVWPMQKQWIRAQKESLVFRLTTEGVSFFVTAAIWTAGAWAVFRWEMQTGTLLVFVGYQAQLTWSIGMLAELYSQFASARAGFDLYQTVMDTHSTVVDASTEPMPENIRGEIAFEDVHFAYDEIPALAGMRFVVAPGQTVALVGRSGSGKSTVANLLQRLYDPDAGRITLDGQDVRRMPLRPYRALFGVVLQDPFLFDDSIAANLRCVRPGATDDEVRDALARAHALPFVERLADGIDHRVGEGGRGLSGGQRQRLSIARCMLLNPRILVLDEATSALDNETERSIQHALEALFEGRTSFVIAHRLDTIRKVDRILVFEDGHVAQDGTFEELSQQPGIFRTLCTIATSTSSRRIKLDEAGFA